MGAWIETSSGSGALDRVTVAPRVGAWIETGMVAQNVRDTMSHPEWVRGLKHVWFATIHCILCRTPSGCVD